jgi:hypothetical protein
MSRCTTGRSSSLRWPALPLCLNRLAPGRAQLPRKPRQKLSHRSISIYLNQGCFLSPRTCWDLAGSSSNRFAISQGRQGVIMSASPGPGFRQSPLSVTKALCRGKSWKYNAVNCGNYHWSRGLSLIKLDPSPTCSRCPLCLSTERRFLEL